MSITSSSISPLSPQRHILITGASSGLGAALALYYARPHTRLTLWGRNEKRLEQVAENARQKGSKVDTLILDVTDSQEAVIQMSKADDAHPVDILILSAGLADIRPQGALAEPADIALKMSLVNFATPVAMSSEMAKRMAERRRGRIAFFSSVASFHDLPLATVYSGSKAGIARFGTALRATMQPHNVKVCVIAPGFVDTPMSQRLEGDQPFLVPVDKAARKIARAINEGKAVLVFPWVFHLTRYLEMFIPKALAHRILHALDVMQHPSVDSTH